MTSQWFQFTISASIGSGRAKIVENYGDGLLGVLPDFSNTADIARSSRGWVDDQTWVDANPKAKASKANARATAPKPVAIEDRTPALSTENRRPEPTTAVGSLLDTDLNCSENEDELGIQANICQTQFIFVLEHLLYFFYNFTTSIFLVGVCVKHCFPLFTILNTIFTFCCLELFIQLEETYIVPFV